MAIENPTKQDKSFEDMFGEDAPKNTKTSLPKKQIVEPTGGMGTVSTPGRINGENENDDNSDIADLVQKAKLKTIHEQIDVLLSAMVSIKNTGILNESVSKNRLDRLIKETKRIKQNARNY